uniref:Uncharacterized protein n=1 Tax=Anguilla anguilla TaxID=7936 RepID=A0A0E9QNH1_ANGAN
MPLVATNYTKPKDDIIEGLKGGA